MAMIRDLYKVLTEADGKPKAKDKGKPKAKAPEREEPILNIKLVDGKKTRDTIAVDFIGGGHYYAYPDLIPKDEVWIEQDLAPDEQVDILVHELIEYALMKQGMTYTPAHNMANKLEKVFRGFEGRWKTKQAPSGDKKVEEGQVYEAEMLLTESYNRALPAFIKYLNGGIDPHDFSHMLDQFFEDEDIEIPANYDESVPFMILDDQKFMDEYRDRFVSWLSQNIDQGDAYAPTYLFMDGAKLVPRQTWLVHFSDDAHKIARNGFQFGAEDYTALGLTTHFSEKTRKKGPGWNFAFDANDRRGVQGGIKKYGREAVMFQSAGVEAYHGGDNEHQIVFWGPNVKERILLQNDGGDWVVKHPSTDKELVRSDNIMDVIGWVKQNHAQYSKVITNDQVAKPIQPTPVKDRAQLQAKKPEHTPQPFESEETPGTCSKCGLAKHRSIPHLCAKGRSKWGTKGGRFTTPERKLYKIAEGISKPTTTFRIGLLPRQMREELYNLHATSVDGEAKENVFYRKQVPMGLIDITGLATDAIPDEHLRDYTNDAPPIVIADGKLVDGQHRILAARKTGLKQLKYIDMTGLISTADSGFISDLPKSAIKESILDDPAEIAKNFASNEHPDGHSVNDYTWAKDKAYSVDKLAHMMPGGTAGWKSWLKDECKMVPGQWDKLAKTEKIDDPVIVSPGHIWDGWHRVAAAIANGHRTIPAIVGRYAR